MLWHIAALGFRDPGVKARNGPRRSAGLSRMRRERPDGLDLRRPTHLLACGLGLGLGPFAPGTLGTLLGVAIFVAAASLPLAAYLALVAAAFGLGVAACARTSRALGVHDHPAIVWDEVVGFLVTMIALPATWPWLLAGFVLFRFFDVAKPPPIAWVDARVGGGLGIMLDDALAGVYGLVLLHLAGAVLKQIGQ